MTLFRTHSPSLRLLYRIPMVLSFIFLAHSGWAQMPEWQGRVTDKDGGLPVSQAVVMALSLPDSTILRFTRTDKEGKFRLTGDATGPVALLVTHPYYADFGEAYDPTGQTGRPIDIRLISKTKLLDAVMVRSGGAIRIKGDTTIYTADSFQVSANANVEELLKKLPGIQVDRNGEIKAMGERVQKVLVDGEEFFGDDPGMAVKNIRADAVKEVQVFDRKSEQASFTGIDDGNTQKTINLKLKEDRKKGYFGKISLSGGLGQDIPPRFNNNLMYGSFKGKRKLSAFVLNGNTGQDGLSWQENQRFGNSEESNFEMSDEDGIFSMSFNRQNEDEPFVNTENGFIRNLNAGLQYSNKWNDKHSINLSPRYNLQDYDNDAQSRTITQLGDSALDQRSETRTRVDRYSIKNTASYDLKLDTSNSIKFTMRTLNSHSESSTLTGSETFGSSGGLKNSSERDSRTTSDKNLVGGTVLFKHRFSKARRTFSVNADWKYNQSTSENLLRSENTAYDFLTPLVVSVDQLTQSSGLSNTFSAKSVYTEPLSKRWAMELSYEYRLNRGTNDQTTYIKNAGGDKYEQPVDSLSNNFRQTIIVHQPSARFNYAFKKYKLSVGSGFGITTFNLLDLTQNQPFDRRYVNLFPTASFVYQYKSNHSFRIRYNGYNTQPTVNQLQPLRNNANIFDQYIGNPDLRPSFTSNVNLTHNGYDFFKNAWSFQTLNLNMTSNAITNNRIIDPVTGATVSRPVNTNGNISASFWGGMGFRTKKKQINLQLGSTLNYNRFVDVINNVSSNSNTVGAGASVEASKAKTDKYDFSIRNEFGFNYNTNAQTRQSNQFSTNTLSVNATVYYKKKWSLVSDYTFYYRQRLNDQGTDLNNHMWNVQLQRTFRSNEFTVFVRVRDLLNQNIGVDRNYYGNSFVEERNVRLRRYVMLGFSWDFKNKMAAPKK